MTKRNVAGAGCRQIGKKKNVLVYQDIVADGGAYLTDQNLWDRREAMVAT